MVASCRDSGAAILTVFLHGRDARASYFRKAGFTLLEVLLSMLLMATLLFTLWSLIETYTSLFAAGQVRIERSQIARSLLEQMSDDLHGAIEDTAPRPRLGNSSNITSGGLASFGGGGQEGDSSAVRRFGLFGSPRELRVDVVQAVSAEDGIAAARWDERQQAAVSNQFDVPAETVSRAPELRTVCYAFNRPQGSEESESPPKDEEDHVEKEEETPPGLVRKEIDFETKSSPEESGSDSPVDDDCVLWAPEVADLEFRYFDGGVWTTSWDSIARRSLPVAVEISLKIESSNPLADTKSQGDAAADETPAEGEFYRLVVQLPTARLQEAVRRLPRSSDSALPPPLPTNRLEKMVLPAAPMSPPEKPQSDKEDEQRWLRTEQ